MIQPGVGDFAGLYSGTAARDGLVVGVCMSVLRGQMCCLVLQYCLPWDSMM